MHAIATGGTPVGARNIGAVTTAVVGSTPTASVSAKQQKAPETVQPKEVQQQKVQTQQPESVQKAQTQAQQTQSEQPSPSLMQPPMTTVEIITPVTSLFLPPTNIRTPSKNQSDSTTFSGAGGVLLSQRVYFIHDTFALLFLLHAAALAIFVQMM
ncbi:hypothetical protein THASP1DRAFT_23865 [Thamnocephalis sphaerospora]|uniref:Uncharacterized protein n=1 Tax=Thamnocephalis sphaerospora TaxID=78915 RepID=A0A4P9XRX0_9FUNG|nr:hypothetical protein THASP1DRAFT_23865 [Thamnocephalis sphaerospora]|eukprot:RKP08080.1 hypothetical protein THASP1DRAFT_23865 [Thamnocephalis sphaerospora]